MSGVTGEMVTGGSDGADIQRRLASLTRRILANPDNIGLRLRLASLQAEAGFRDEAFRTLGEAVARFPNNGLAKTRFEALRDSGVAVSVATPVPVLADATRFRDAEARAAPAPAQAAEPIPGAIEVPERRFVAQDELISLARIAQGRPDDGPALAIERPPSSPPIVMYPAELQAEPSLRLRLNPLSPRYRAEMYFAASLIAIIVLSGIVVWRWPNSGLLVDRGTITPIVLAPRPPEPAIVSSPAPMMLPPGSIPVAASRTVPDSLATPQPLSVLGRSPDAPPAIAAPALPPLPEQTALPNVSLSIPAGDAHAARMVADLTARLQQAGMAVHPETRAARQDTGVAYFFAEDAALARTVASVLGLAADQVRQAQLSPGGVALPGAIRVTLPTASESRQPG